METNKTLLEVMKTQITTAITDTLSPVQATKFIDTVVDMSDFLKLISVDKNIKTSLTLDSLTVASRQLRAGTEGADNVTPVGIGANKRTLTPVEVVLPYDLSFSWLESNLEGESAESKVNGMFAKLFGNDLVDLIFNGDGATASFLSILQGIMASAELDASSHPFTRDGTTDWKGTVFPTLFSNMPDKYKANRKGMAYFVNYQVEQEYRQSLADRVTALGDAYLTEARSAQFMGVDIIPVPSVPYGTILLTPKENIHLGFGRDMRVGKFINERKRAIEYTITARVDADYAVSDAISYCV